MGEEVLETFKRFREGLKAYAAGDEGGGMMRAWEAVGERPVGAFEEALPTIYKRGLYDNAHALRVIPLRSNELTCEALGAIDTPTLLLHGGRSNSWYIKTTQEVARCVPGSAFASIAGDNHMTPIFKPDDLTRVILEHVGRHPRRAP